MATTRVTSVRARAIKNGYRSGLEEKIAKQLEEAGVPFDYEKLKVSYELAETRKYTVDFQLPNGIIVETKGLFKTEDRKKHLLIQKQHPELDIRFVFSNSRAKLYKGSKTTYAMWCEQYNFKWADKVIPTEWINEQ